MNLSSIRMRTLDRVCFTFLLTLSLALLLPWSQGGGTAVAAEGGGGGGAGGSRAPPIMT